MLSDVHRAFAVDALASSHPLSAKEEDIQKPAQISELFDAISYSKVTSFSHSQLCFCHFRRLTDISVLETYPNPNHNHYLPNTNINPYPNIVKARLLNPSAEHIEARGPE